MDHDTITIRTSRQQITMSWDGGRLIVGLLMQSDHEGASEAVKDFSSDRRRPGDPARFAETTKPAVLSVMLDALQRCSPEDDNAMTELCYELMRDTGHPAFQD